MGENCDSDNGCSLTLVSLVHALSPGLAIEIYSRETCGPSMKVEVLLDHMT